MIQDMGYDVCCAACWWLLYEERARCIRVDGKQQSLLLLSDVFLCHIYTYNIVTKKSTRFSHKITRIFFRNKLAESILLLDYMLKKYLYEYITLKKNFINNFLNYLKYQNVRENNK